MSKPTFPIRTSASEHERSPDLTEIEDLIRTAANQRQGDCLALLELLRQLNNIHYEIRETLFQNALPDKRQKLYSLLKDIEREGGWPYIPKMKLMELLQNIDETDSATEE